MQHFQYMHLEILDFAEEAINEHFARTYEFIDEALANGGKVLVHWYDNNLIFNILINKVMTKN